MTWEERAREDIGKAEIHLERMGFPSRLTVDEILARVRPIVEEEIEKWHERFIRATQDVDTATWEWKQRAEQAEAHADALAEALALPELFVGREAPALLTYRKWKAEE